MVSCFRVCLHTANWFYLMVDKHLLWRHICQFIPWWQCKNDCPRDVKHKCNHLVCVDLKLSSTKFLTLKIHRGDRMKVKFNNYYNYNIICHKTEFIYGTLSYAEAFDPDDPTLMDRYPRYDMNKQLGDRPLTPIH
jgi:hypothetical protein